MAAEAALPLYTMLPFALMLIAIAVFPLWLPHWWEHNLNKLLVAALLGLPVLGLYLRRAPGALLIMGAAFLMKSTVTDVVELLSGHPRTFTAVARSVEGKAFLHPVFQAVRFREGKGFATPYMFAYGGKHLVAGQQYVVTVLPRSRWLLSAHEATETASQ